MVKSLNEYLKDKRLEKGLTYKDLSLKTNIKKKEFINLK